jgi:hypothetical protein
LKFIYKDPLLPEYCCYSPGACYIVSKHQVLKNTKEFYLNLNKIISYTLDPKFPSEAHQIERMMHIIFSSSYVTYGYMNDLTLFDNELKNIDFIEITSHLNYVNPYNKIKDRFKRIIKKIES